MIPTLTTELKMFLSDTDMYENTANLQYNDMHLVSQTTTTIKLAVETQL